MNYKLRGAFSKNENCLNDILLNRGVENIKEFLNPSPALELNPYDLDNIERGAEMLLKHLREGSRILFIVDADADGFCSSSILWNYCKKIFPQANLNFSVHEGKRHGLNDKIDWIETEDFNLIITPDASSYDKDEMERIIAMGSEVLAIDHHDAQLDESGNIHILSNNEHAVIINNQLSPRYANKTLCGAGMVYKFCEILDDMLGINSAQDYLDLVAIAEISDVMFQGVSETRYLITQGLKQIKNEGIKALIEAQSYSLKEKAISPYLDLTPIDIAFYISPLINSITRVGTVKENEGLFYALIEPNKLLPSTKRGAKPGDTETAAGQAARVATNAKNRQNKTIERALDILEYRIHKEGLLENNILYIEVFPEDNIPQSITGLLCQKFVSKYNRPCLIGRRSDDGFLRGSMRGNVNFASLPSLKEFLENTGYFEYVSGHANAAGQSIDANKLESFIEFTNKNLKEEDFENCHKVDFVFDAMESSLNTVGTILAENQSCFGNGVDEAKIIVENIPLSNILIMGADKTSIKISCNGIDYVKFKDADFIEEVQTNRMKKLNILVRLNLNTFSGRTTLQGFIEDYEFIDDQSKYEF